MQFSQELSADEQVPGPRGEDRGLRDGARHLPGGLLPQGRQGHAARQVDAARSLP